MPKNFPIRLFISYSHRDCKLRDKLVDQLSSLERDGVIHAWHDRMIGAGQEWAGAIDANLETADIILCLVSADFIASSYIFERELSRALERHEAEEACVIPVILRPAEWDATPLAKLQALPENARPVTNWRNRDDAFLSIARGIRKKAQEWAKRQHEPATALNPSPTAPSVEAQPDLSAFTPHHAEEMRCQAELDKPRALIRIQAPKGFGKLEFTSRLVAYASAKGYRSVALNLISTDHQYFQTTESFSKWFCKTVSVRLGLRTHQEDYWKNEYGPNHNVDNFFETYLLEPDERPLVLVINHFDRIFGFPAIETDFCGLLRSWYEVAVSNVFWQRFRLVLTHSREPNPNLASNSSPFNVGLYVALNEWSPEQVRTQVGNYGLQLSDADLNRLFDLVGGHPFLVSKALQELAHGLPLVTLLDEAASEEGVYGEHLRGLLTVAGANPHLGEALRQVVLSPEPVRIPHEAAKQLKSLGMVVPKGPLWRTRCSLYALYLAERLYH